MKVIKGVFKAVVLIVCIALAAAAIYMAYIFVTSGFNTSAVEHEVELIKVKAESFFSDEAGVIEDKIGSSAESVTKALENAGDKAGEAIGGLGGKVEELVESVGDKISGD